MALPDAYQINGPAFPTVPAPYLGQYFNLTAVAGSNQPGPYVYLGGVWTAVHAYAAPPGANTPS